MDVREGHSPQRYCNLSLGLQFMEYKKKTFLSEHYQYVYSCNLSLQFRNTSFDKLAFDRRERVGRIIRPALLKTH